MTKFKIKSGDKVIVTNGKDKGKTGTVLRMVTKDHKVVVSGINIVKKHQKPTQKSEGGIISKEMPLHISNVAHIDPKSGKATKVGYKVLKDGTKTRIAKKSGEIIKVEGKVMLARFKELYKQAKPELKAQFEYKNIHEIPKIEKVVLNMGVGEAVADSKVIGHAVNDMTLISGQKPLVAKAKLSVATFKLREGMQVGCKVTLRKDRMYEFLERLVMIALPRVKEFKGFNKKSFDGRGNFTFGIKEQIVFPEINYDRIDKIRGLDITIVTSAKNDKEAQALLSVFHLPFSN